MLELLRNLVEVESTLENGEYEAALVLKDYFSKAGIDCEVDVWGDNQANITAVIEGEKDDKKLLFASHLDVVPKGNQEWEYPPFRLTEKDGCFFGRGVVDMKGGMAASAAAIVELVKRNGKPERGVVFSATSAEEVNSSGAKRFVEKSADLKGKFKGVIVPEPTSMKPGIAHKGILWVKANFKGKTSHGSMPEKGINAFENALLFISEVKKLHIADISNELFGNCTVSFNKIQCGKAVNVVPDLCSLWMDIRLINGVDSRQILSMLNDVVAKLGRQAGFECELAIERSCPSLFTSPESGFVCEVCDILSDKTIVLNFTTDAPYFAQFDAPCVVLGPGDPTMCHQPNEKLAKSELLFAKEKYEEMITKI